MSDEIKEQPDIIDPPGLKGGPGRQQQLVREYIGKYQLWDDDPPCVVDGNGEAILSMMWPVHDQSAEGEQAAVEYTRKLAEQIAGLLNTKQSEPVLHCDGCAPEFMDCWNDGRKCRKRPAKSDPVPAGGNERPTPDLVAMGLHGIALAAWAACCAKGGVKGWSEDPDYYASIIARTFAPMKEARDRLERERDEAREANICDACAGSGKPVSSVPCMCKGTGRMSDAVVHIRECFVSVMAERDALSATVAELRQDIEGMKASEAASVTECNRLTERLADSEAQVQGLSNALCNINDTTRSRGFTKGHGDERVIALAQDRDALAVTVEQLKAFKAYVHERLDKAGVPHTVEDEHLAAGCRIGGRLGWIIKERDEAREDKAELTCSLGLCEIQLHRLEKQVVEEGPHIFNIQRTADERAAIIVRLEAERDALKARLAETEQERDRLKTSCCLCGVADSLRAKLAAAEQNGREANEVIAEMEDKLEAAERERDVFVSPCGWLARNAGLLGKPGRESEQD